MSKINIDLDNFKNEDGTYSERDAKSIERLTGKPFTEVVKQAEAQDPPDKPDRPVSDWTGREKIDFISKYGRQAFEKLL